MNVLAPFGKSKNYHKQFSVIDVIVPFGREEGAREIGARVEVTVGVSLEQDGSCCE